MDPVACIATFSVVLITGVSFEYAICKNSLVLAGLTRDPLKTNAKKYIISILTVLKRPLQLQAMYAVPFRGWCHFVRFQLITSIPQRYSPYG